MNRAIRAVVRTAAALAAGVLLCTLAACSSVKPAPVPSDTGVEPAVTVQVVDNRFVPANVEIAAGEAVRWVFEGPGEHDVVASDGSFVSELVSSGEYVHVFGAAGSFAYDCSIHPEMVGTVTVR